MKKYLNLEYQADDKARAIYKILDKLINSNSDFVITIDTDSLITIYNKDGTINETNTEKTNKILKNKVTEKEMVHILKNYEINDLGDELDVILPDQYIIGNNSDLVFNLIRLGDISIDDRFIDFFYDRDNKTIFIDTNSIMHIYEPKEDDVIDSLKEDDEKSSSAKIKKDDKIDISLLKQLDELDENDEIRAIITILYELMKISDVNDFGDVIFSEGDFPYYVSGNKIIYDDLLDAEIKRIFNNKPISHAEMEYLINGIEENSSTKNILDEIKKDFDKGGEGFVDLAVMQQELRGRVNVSYRVGKEYSIVIRVIRSGTPPLMEDLGLIDKTTTAYRDVLSQPFGLILIVGPTGSGKSFSLTSMLGEINRTQRKRIITLEDPIEFMHENNLSRFEQKEVGVDVASYELGLHALLRQKPHIAVCGEVRDGQTFELLSEIASTGHVAFATFHASDVVQAIQRIIEMYPAEKQKSVRQNLSELLIGIFVQKLVPRKGGGKTLIKEIMVNNKNTRDAIFNNDMKSLEAAIESGSNYGMMTNDQSIKNQFNAGQITDKVAYSYAKNKPHIQKYTGYDIYEK